MLGVSIGQVHWTQQQAKWQSITKISGSTIGRIG